MSLSSSSTSPDQPMATTAVNVDDESHSHRTIAKRKRTKRRRLHDLPPPPPPASRTAASPSSSASSANPSGSFSTTTTTTEEEEDMANCLILLARGGDRALDAASGNPSEDRKVVGEYVYECRTCNRTFPSFQALGGHRASHKKPKTTVPSMIAMAPPSTEGKKEIVDEINSVDNLRTPFATFPKPRMHLCSMCGLAFSSGQALGGHMRRHRPVMTAVAAAEERRKERGLFTLDLNLPAPSDEDHGEAAAAAKALVPSSPAAVFPFAGTPPTALLFSSALVDCHY